MTTSHSTSYAPTGKCRLSRGRRKQRLMQVHMPSRRQEKWPRMRQEAGACDFHPVIKVTRGTIDQMGTQISDDLPEIAYFEKK